MFLTIKLTEWRLRQSATRMGCYDDLLASCHDCCSDTNVCPNGSYALQRTRRPMDACSLRFLNWRSDTEDIVDRTWAWKTLLCCDVDAVCCLCKGEKSAKRAGGLQLTSTGWILDLSPISVDSGSGKDLSLNVLLTTLSPRDFPQRLLYHDSFCRLYDTCPQLGTDILLFAYL